MKTILGSILLLFLLGIVRAATFSVGGVDIEVPSPEGFSRVTEEMDAVYRMSLNLADPMNDQLAYYIAESDAPVAMSGEMPSLKRYYILKVNRELKNRAIGSKGFAELKSVTKRQNREIFKSVETQMSGLMEKTSKGISNEFDVDFALKLSQMVPLDPHYEADNALAYSMYCNLGVAVEGSKRDVIVSVTATFVNVAGKVLFLYCYGSQEDLEWTRSASKAWAEIVMASNSQPPSHSSDNRGFDWNRVLERGLIGAIVGGLMGLFAALFSRSKKKKS